MLSDSDAIDTGSTAGGNRQQHRVGERHEHEVRHEPAAVQAGQRRHPVHRHQRKRRAGPRHAAATGTAFSAVDLKGHDDAVTDANRRDIFADGDDLGDALVTDRVARRHRQNALGDTDIEIAAGHRQRTHDRLPAVGDIRLCGVPPLVSPDLGEHQLLHRRILL